MKAVTLVSIVVSAIGFSSCCCQTQPMPPLRPEPKDLIQDQVIPVEPVKVEVIKCK